MASSHVYAQALKSMYSGGVNLATDSIKVMLLKSGYVPDYDAHQYLADVNKASNEPAASGTYPAGGSALANASSTRWAYNANTNAHKFDADDILWTGTSLTARYALLYDDTAANKPLLVLVDFGQDQISVNGPFAISWDALGIFTLTAP